MAQLLQELTTERDERNQLEAELKDELRGKVQLEVKIELAHEEKQRLLAELRALNNELERVNPALAHALTKESEREREEALRDAQRKYVYHPQGYQGY